VKEKCQQTFCGNGNKLFRQPEGAATKLALELPVRLMPAVFYNFSGNAKL
jgi:hypothetical protein